MTLHDVSALPSALLALHVNLPASSREQDVISSEQTPTMYDTEYLESAVMSSLPRYHVIYTHDISHYFSRQSWRRNVIGRSVVL